MFSDNKWHYAKNTHVNSLVKKITEARIRERQDRRVQSGGGGRTGACKCKRLTRDYAFKMSGLFLNNGSDRRTIFWRNPRYANAAARGCICVRWKVRAMRELCGHIQLPHIRVTHHAFRCRTRVNCIISWLIEIREWRDYSRRA